MELRQLQLFIAAAEEGNITAAARRMHLTQPALSRQIKSLEEELGVELFTRGAHSVALTPAGAILQGEAAKLLRFCEAMVEKVRTEGTGELLRVAYAPTLTRGFLPRAISHFSRLHPRVRISLSDCSSAEMHTGLAEGKFDIVLGVPCGGDTARWTVLREAGWKLMIPVNHPLAAQEKISPASLDGERLVILGREEYPDYWQRVTRYFRDRGLQAKIGGEADGASSMEAAVEAGMGIAIIGEQSTAGMHRNSRITVREMTEEPDRLVIAAGVAAARGTSAGLLAFIEELRLAAEEEGSDLKEKD